MESSWENEGESQERISQGDGRVTSERWQTIKEILDTSLDLSPEQRPNFLKRRCGDDRALREDVERLLAMEEKAENLMERPAISLRPQDPNPLQIPDESRTADANLGRRIGPYKIEGLLGRGGMGAVYLAVREDDYEKRVALKIVPGGPYSAELSRRFRHERQILARLEHPQIARLLDGGTTDDGLPYLVMEYIEGEPIDRYCHTRRLPTRERLELFRRILEPVRFAHQNLVVHRDLKPSNIVVTPDGVPKLVDFGIAKLLEPASASQVLTHDKAPMTLKYASPEQLRGEPITTASDIYSLGVVLYQLLTGRLPCHLDLAPTPQIIRAVCEEEPQKPSTAIRHAAEVEGAGGRIVQLTPESVSRSRRTDPRRLRRRLTGDLDAITLMALRKEPRRRYGFVEQLSEDLRRHLVGLPVRARKRTLPYRVGKFARRNKLAVAVLLLMLGSWVTTLVQWQKAVREQRRSERVSTFLKDLFRASDPDRTAAEILPASEILDRGRELIGETLEGEPELFATLTATMGRVYLKLGRYEDARLLLERSLEVRRAVLGEEDPLVARSRQYLASLYRKTGDLPATEKLLREALEVERRLLPPDDPELVIRFNNLAVLLYEKGDYAAAEELFREVLATRRKLHGEDHPDVVRTLNNLAALFEIRGQYEDAESHYRRGLAIRLELHGPEHWEVARSLYNLAVVLSSREKYVEAEELLRRSLRIRTDLYGRDHPDVALSLSGLAQVLSVRGGWQEAEQRFQEALAIQRARLGEEHPQTARTKRNLALHRLRRGVPAAAESLIREALASLRAKRPEGHWEIADAESVLGACLVAMGRFEDAEPLLIGGYEGLARIRGVQAVPTRKARLRLVELYTAWGRPEEVERHRPTRE